MPVRRLVLLLTAALALGPATAARASWNVSQALDGPNADVVGLGSVDVARDGNGAVAYLRRDGGVTHVFVSRLFGGVWQSPVRVDPGLGAATEAKVAVGDGNRIAVAWIADGSVYAASTAVSATPAPFSAPVQIGGPDAHSVDVDLGVNDAAYAVWEQTGDVRAARLQDATWTTLAAPLDINAANSSGAGAGRPRVAVSAEGYAVATWGETSDRSRVYARRLTGLNLSAYPQQVSQDADGGAADSADIDIEEDGSFAWVVYRQDTSGGSRSFARRLVGSQFEPMSPIDGGIPSSEPRIDINGRGAGEGVAQALGGGVVGSVLDRDVFEPSLAVGASSTPAAPEVASTDRGPVAIAWRSGTDALARYKPYREAFAPAVTVSNPAFGPVNDPGVSIGGDRVGDFAVAMVQGVDGARALTVAVYDDPPTSPYIGKAEAYKRKTRPELKWRAGTDLWGEQTYRVFMDGVQIGQTKASSLVPATPLTTGRHKWFVEAVDLRGQTARSRERTMKLDATAPTLSVRVDGKRARGSALKIRVTAKDKGGSGLDHTTIDFGDHSSTTRSRKVTHHYRAGKFTLKVAAVDKAGNVTRKEVKLRIKK
jgi:hypothetical protein